MAETTEFELVTPEKLVFSERSEMVVVPGSEGLFAAMPRHAPFISTLKPGVLEVYEGGKVKQRIFVAGGFAEVTPERLTVLAEEAVPVADLDRGQVETRLKDLKDDLAAAKSDAEKAQVMAAIDIAEAKLKAAA
ncbi:MAG: F0F1 ATP synthase subunit epsilon [Alphaproteobacteria bacterium]|nr:F0F1 ATP synthase subunit epsilon [Alphaproteobacteria bacterium]